MNKKELIKTKWMNDIYEEVNKHGGVTIQIRDFVKLKNRINNLVGLVKESELIRNEQETIWKRHIKKIDTLRIRAEKAERWVDLLVAYYIETEVGDHPFDEKNRFENWGKKVKDILKYVGSIREDKSGTI